MDITSSRFKHNQQNYIKSFDLLSAYNSKWQTITESTLKIAIPREPCKSTPLITAIRN